MFIAEGKGVEDTNWENKDVSWEYLCQRMEHPIRTPETFKQYQRMTKKQKAKAKNVGAFMGGKLEHDGRRKAESVEFRSMLTFDLDECTDAIIEKLKESPYKLGMYSTHSHTSKKPRIRVLIPLTRNVTAAEFEAIARKTAADWKLINAIDKASFRVAQCMYWPSAASDGDYFYHCKNGKILNADNVLNQYDDWKNVEEWPRCREERNIPKAGGHVRRKDPRGDSSVSQKFCSQYTIQEAIEQFLSDKYLPTDNEDRWTYAEAETSGGLVVYDNGLWAYSFHQSDPASDGHIHSAFELVQIHKFGTGPQGYQKMVNFAVRDLQQYTNTELTEPAEETAEDRLPESQNWMENLEYDSKTLQLKGTRRNLSEILKHDDAFINVRYNVLAIQVEVNGNCPWRKSKAPRSWDKRDTVRAMEYVEQKYQVEFKKADFEDKILNTADERWVNPVVDYLEGLPEWDGMPRAKTMLCDYLGAKDTPYTEEATLKWLLGAVKRAYEPGCKFDYVLILQGPQGIGKSTLAAKLAGSWFSDSLDFSDMVDTKKAAEKLAGTWIDELPELKGMNKVESSAAKSFITSTSDRFREPWAPSATDHPRGCVMIGTTNDDSYLRDSTGSRRYWPVKVTGAANPIESPIGMEQPEIDMIWAEVVEIYKTNPDIPLCLSKEVQAEAQEWQLQALESDDREGFLQNYLEMPLPSNWSRLSVPEQRSYVTNFKEGSDQNGSAARTEVTISEIWQVCFQEKESNREKRQSQQIAAMLKRLHWETDGKREKTQYGWQRVYRKIKE